MSALFFCKNANTHPSKRQSIVLKIYLFQTIMNNQWRQPVENLSEDEAIGTDSESGDEGNQQENALVVVKIHLSFHCSHTGFVKICVLENFVISKNNVNVK